MSKKDEKGVVSDTVPPPEEESVGAQPAAGEGPEAAVDHDEVQKRTAELQQEIASLKDQVLRRAADYENFRKRMAREREDAVAYANQMFALDLVPVIDDFERALASVERSRDFDALHDGIQLIERQLTSMLEKKWSLVRFDSVGQPFDPHRHQAIVSEDREDVQQATVVEEYQKGYMFRDRVLRAARVKVVQPRPRTSDPQDNGQHKET